MYESVKWLEEKVDMHLSTETNGRACTNNALERRIVEKYLKSDLSINEFILVNGLEQWKQNKRKAKHNTCL